MTNKTLQSFLPRKGITIISGYTDADILVYVAAYELDKDNSIEIRFPKGHRFKDGQFVTLHLDNRTGVEEYDSDLRVYRTSYRGIVSNIKGNDIKVLPKEFMCYYSNDCVIKYVSPDFQYDFVNETNPIPESGIEHSELRWTGREYENKLGVLITRLKEYPHSSLMAFLSTECDDIFLITLKSLFKSSVIHRDNRCCFAIDHRSDFVFEKAYDWNYTIVEADAYTVSNSNPVFEEIQSRFVDKNPWEASFFLSPEVEMFHLKPNKILMPDTI